MIEYILQTLSLLAVLLVYIFSGCVVFAKVKEPYKSTPLRSFAVGAGLWVVISMLSSIFFTGVSLKMLWFAYAGITVLAFLGLSDAEEKKVCSKLFFYQLATAFMILIPVLYFIQNDNLTLWQEFAVYAKSFFSLAESKTITHEVLKDPLAYQLVILPVSFLFKVQNNIFAGFNWLVFSLVACEFVRNSGVKVLRGNILFPLAVAFSILVFLNPFGILEHSLAADPFILTCALALALSDCIFRLGFLSKNLASIPFGLILMLLVLCSGQGILLAGSLFLVILLRYIVQTKDLTTQQLLGIVLMPCIAIFMWSIWECFLNTRGYSFVPIGWSEFSFTKFEHMYKALFIMSKEHILECVYLALVLLAGIYRFRSVKKIEDIILDKYLLRTVFWVIIIYVGIGLPLYFIQYESVARASYSLSFGYISLLQFVILMPIGRVVKEEINRHHVKIPKILRITILTGLLLTFIMEKRVFMDFQNYRITNVTNIGEYLKEKTKKDTRIAFVDTKRMVRLYKSVLEFNDSDRCFISYHDKNLSKGLVNIHKQLRKENIDYVVLHAPTNLLTKNFEYNFNPDFSYIYIVEEKGFRLDKKIENKYYKDTNMTI